MNNGDPRFPSSRFLRVPFVFVPRGSPPPLEWMRDHPNHVTVRGFFIPDPPSETDMALEPQYESEAQATLVPEKQICLVPISSAGKWAIARPVPPLTPQPAPEPEVELEPPRRPDDLRCVPPPRPRRARGGPPPLGPNPAATAMDPLAPEFTHNLVRKTALVLAGMDRVMRPGGIATPEGLSAAVRAGMQHLATHKGDIAAGLASLKAAGAAGHNSEPTPPTPWTHRISKAEADRLFVAACHAACAATPDPKVYAQPEQRRRVLRAALATARAARAARQGSKPATPLPHSVPEGNKPASPASHFGNDLLDLGGLSPDEGGAGSDGLLPGVQLASLYVVSPPARRSSDPHFIPAAGTKKILGPEPQAVGPHSTFRRAPDGSVQHYETYEHNPRAGTYDPVLRYRGTGKEHNKVKTPYVMERAPGKGSGSTPIVPRPARPQEIPRPVAPTMPQAPPPPPALPLPASPPAPTGPKLPETDIPDGLIL